MKHAPLLAFLSLTLTVLACSGGAAANPALSPTSPSVTLSPTVTPGPSIFDSGRTVYGFFPSPPEMTVESLLATLDTLAQHGDVALIQKAVPWKDFLASPDGDSQDFTDERNLVAVAASKGLEPIFVIDPLNGLDRRQFSPLPTELKGADFGTPALRQAYLNYAIRLARTFHPRYLGLASEINTYADAHPDDFPRFVDLYKQTYQAIKAESPGTQIFVTFQWEDLNHVGLFKGQGTAFRPEWSTVDAFEPDLDVLAISTYPFVAFDHASQVPPDYYEPLLGHGAKLLAVAEGGWPSTDLAPFHGSPEDQVRYLQTINEQLGGHLAFWIYLIVQDFNLEAYRPVLQAQGMGANADTLGWFTSVGLRTYEGQPKPALATWDSTRSKSQ